MEEPLCSACRKPLPSTSYGYRYCPVCRLLYGVEERTDLAPKKGFQLGRDRFGERLRDGFELMDDSDPEEKQKG